MFQFELSEENEWCYGCDLCVICNKPYKHRRVWLKKLNEELPCLREYIAHPSCEKIVNEIKKKKNEIRELEDQLCYKKLSFNYVYLDGKN